MAREHARILTRIWRDDQDWRALDWEAQHMYFLLLSQASLTYAGTLPLTLQRWSRLTDGRTVNDVEKAVRLLEERRFVVVDWETEELLVRTYIRNDGVHRQPNVLKAAMRVALEDVESVVIRAAIAAELDRVGLTEYAARLDPSRTPSPDPSPNPSGKGKEPQVSAGVDSAPEGGTTIPSTNPSGNPNGQGVPETRGRGEGGVGKSRSVGSSVGGTRGTRIPDDFAVTPEMVAWVRDRCPDVDGKLETERFKLHFETTVGAKGVKLSWFKTWQNWMLEEQKRANQRNSRNVHPLRPGARLPRGYDDDGVMRDPKTGVAIER